MKKRIQDIRERDREESLLTYGRPSVSAWIAAAAVAFAFFVLGGFIKTYRQLESLREESRQEMAELRETIRRLREDRAVVGPAAGGYQPPRFQALPPARRDYYEEQRPAAPQPQGYGETRQEPVRRSGLRPEPAPTAPHSARPAADPGYLDQFVEPAIERPRYQLGRTYESGEERLIGAGGGACQVISVSNDRKRLIVEGGRDLGLNEGARLELCRDGRWTADIRIVDVYDSQSSCEVLHATVPPQPGDTIRRAPQSR